jgi:O-acetyl-ADP-ribose deacetylase (regulator of RNase III)
MAHWNRRVHNLGRRTITLAEASIAELGERVDALVSSDNNRLTHGGGVSDALWTAAGSEVDRFVDRARPILRLGDVFMSPAGELDARVLLHAVTIDLDANRAISDADISLLYRRVLTTAEECECQSVALPLLGTGAARLSVESAVRGLTQALDSWLAGPSYVKGVIVVALGARYAVADRAVETVTRYAVAMDELVSYAVQDSDPVGGSLVRSWRDLSQPTVTERSALLGVLFDSSVRLAARRILETVGGAIGSSLGGNAATTSDHKRITQLIPGAVSSQTIEQVVDFLPRAAALTGFRNASPLEPVLRRGLLARNRLAYQAYSPDLVVDRDHLCVAVRDVLRLMISSEGTPPAFVVRGDARWPEFNMPAAHPEPDQAASLDSLRHAPSPHSSPRRRRPPTHRRHREPPYAAMAVAQPEPSIPLQPAVRSQPGGTEHVRRLHELMMTHVTGADRISLDERLQHEGYEGDYQSRLLEKCVRVPNPAGFILEELGMPGMRAAYESLFGRAAGPEDSPARLARQIAAHIGFPQRPKPVGLKTVLTKVSQRRHAIQLATATEIRAMVTDIGCDLEFICQVLIRFLSQAAFGKPADLLLREWRLLSGNQAIGSVGLGTLLKLAEDIDKRLGGEQSALAHLFTDAVKRRRLFPDDLSILPQVRNAFAHYQQEEQHASHDKVLRANAVAFLDAAKAMLEHLQSPEGRVFPQIILVDSVVIDQWGRRTVKAVDDDGHPHTIFADTPLEPGQAYFMHSRTNPLRVDPILVPAGDLTWPRVD